MSTIQTLLDAAKNVIKEKMTGHVNYYSFADNSHDPKEEFYWRHLCYSMLEYSNNIDEAKDPAFITLRIGYNNRIEDREFISFICNPELSPWRAFKDELFPSDKQEFSYDSKVVDINSLDFRNNVGLIITKNLSVRVAVNFLKAYRLTGEHPEYVTGWYKLVSNGVDPGVAITAASYVSFEEDYFHFPYTYGHNIFEYPDYETIDELYNIKNGLLSRNDFSKSDLL